MATTEIHLVLDDDDALVLASILEMEAVAHVLPDGAPARPRGRRGGGYFYAPTAEKKYNDQFNAVLEDVARQLREQS